MLSVRAATDNGLSNEAALAALTSNAAAILGVSNRLGTVEKGKIANLVLASDWPWADGAEVRAVFVDGRMYQDYKSDEPVEAPKSDVSGTWAMTMQSPRGAREMTADITMSKDGKVKGKITSDRGVSHGRGPHERRSPALQDHARNGREVDDVLVDAPTSRAKSCRAR